MSVKGFKGLDEPYDYNALENQPNISGMINAGISGMMNSVSNMVSGSTIAGNIAHNLTYPQSIDHILMYSESSTYTKGAVVLYGTNAAQAMYRAKQDISTAEAWTVSHWEKVSYMSLILALKEEISDLNQRIAALEG